MMPHDRRRSMTTDLHHVFACEECGARKHVNRTWSRTSLSFGRVNVVSVARRSSTSLDPIRCAIAIASGPLRRMTARAPRPLGVDSAIVFIVIAVIVKTC